MTQPHEAGKRPCSVFSENMIEPTIITKEAMIIAGPIVSCRGVGFKHLEPCRSEFKTILSASKKRIGKEDKYAVGFTSVPREVHGSRKSATDGLEHLMIVGIQVEDLHGLPIGIVGMELPATKYAVFTHHGSPISMLEKTIKPAYDWIKSSNYQLNGPFDVEHENADFLDDGINLNAKSYFWLPIIENDKFEKS